jgi:feruloyl esterase
MRIVILVAALTAPLVAKTCEDLASLALPRSIVTLAQSVAAGQLTLPPGAMPVFPGAPALDLSKLGELCRVAATLKPSADSDIKIEVWLPDSGWNGKLESVGNGAWAGNISYRDLVTAVSAGYAAASTDTGHTDKAEIFGV